MSGEGGIIDIRARLAVVEPLAQAATNEANVLTLIATNRLTASSGLVRVGNEIRMAIGTLPTAG